MVHLARGAVRWPRKRAVHPGGCFDLVPDGGGPFISPLQLGSRVGGTQSVNRPNVGWLGL